MSGLAAARDFQEPERRHRDRTRRHRDPPFNWVVGEAHAKSDHEQRPETSDVSVRGKKFWAAGSEHQGSVAIRGLRNTQETGAAAERGRHERQDRGKPDTGVGGANRTPRAAGAPEDEGGASPTRCAGSRIWLSLWAVSSFPLSQQSPELIPRLGVLSGKSDPKCRRSPRGCYLSKQRF